MKKVFLALLLLSSLLFNCSKEESSYKEEEKAPKKEYQEETIPSKYYVLSPDKKTLMHWFNTEAISIDMQEDKQLREVTKISENVFENCKKVVSIVLPNKLTDIGINAFGQCESLKSIIIPEGVTVINDKTFYNCKSLTQVKLPQNLKTIGEYTFYNCTSLESIDIPNSVESIKDGAFYNSGFTSITIPKRVTFVSTFTNSKEPIVFYQCKKLKSITLLNNMTSIGTSFISHCDVLEEVKLPETLIAIEGVFLSDCKSMKHITIPHNVRKINSFAFYSSNISTITLEGTIPPELDSSFFPENQIKKIYVPSNSVSAYKMAMVWSKYADIIEAKP